MTESSLIIGNESEYKVMEVEYEQDGFIVASEKYIARNWMEAENFLFEIGGEG